MKHDLKERRKKLGISCADIAKAFGVSRHNMSYHDRNGTYTEEVKQWMDKQEEKKEGGFNLKDSIKKLFSIGKEHEQRLKSERLLSKKKLSIVEFVMKPS